MPTYHVNSNVGEDDGAFVYPPGMSDIGDRIRKARRDKRVTQIVVAKHMGVSRPTVTQWENGTHLPDIERIDPLARFLGVTPEWLLTGRNLRDAVKNLVMDEATISGFLPITWYVEAGRWFDIDDDQKASVDFEIPVLAGHDISLQRAFVVSGNSINKIAKPGDILICLDYIGANKDVKPGELVIVERSRFGGHMVGRTAKRLRRAANGSWELWPESDDPAFQTPIILSDAADHEEIRIAYTVLWIIKRPI